mgnify:CR=1 FL=1
MSRNKQPSKEEVEKMVEEGEAVIHEVPPYTKISIAVSSEGFQVELEENAPFEQAHKNYNKILKDIVDKQLVGKRKEKQHDKSNVDVA